MRIALLSDIHFGKDGCSYDFSAIGDAIENIEYEKSDLKKSLFVELRKQSLDLILISGDITSTGSPSEFLSFKKFLEEMSIEVGVLRDRIVWIGGNHDVWRVPIEKAGNVRGGSALDKERWSSFQRVGSKIMDVILGSPESNHSNTKADDFSTYYDFGEVGIFTLHSAFDADHLMNKYGRIGRDQLEWLDRALSQSTCKWKIIMLHHHPIDYQWPIPYKDMSSLEEGPEICLTASKYSVDLICHGHRHIPNATNMIRSEWASDISFLCAGSLSVNAKERSNGSTPNVFHVIDLKENGEARYIALTNFAYSISQGWSVIRGAERPELPIQGEVVLCSAVSDEQIVELLKAYVVRDGAALEIPAYKNLPYQIQSKSFGKITELIKSNYNSTHDIPDDYVGDRIVYWKK
ncbi:MAG: hypothetical protein RL173_381 [Fibrobacterota bacterium]